MLTDSDFKVLRNALRNASMNGRLIHSWDCLNEPAKMGVLEYILFRADKQNSFQPMQGANEPKPYRDAGPTLGDILESAINARENVEIYQRGKIQTCLKRDYNNATQKINAIKTLRANFGFGLRDAKYKIDDVEGTGSAKIGWLYPSTINKLNIELFPFGYQLSTR